MEKEFVINGLKRALCNRRHAIINSDQGSHFTNADYLDLLKEHDVQVSMDGKGRATDNSRTKRFFSALKYECIYLYEFQNPRELRKGIRRYVSFYNVDRPHQSLAYQTPEKGYKQHEIAQAC